MNKHSKKRWMTAVAVMVLVAIVAGTTWLFLHEPVSAPSNVSAEQVTNAVKAAEPLAASPDPVPVGDPQEKRVGEGTESITLIVAISGLVALSIGLLLLSFWLYRWRRSVIGDKEIVVPEDWRKNSDALIQRHLVLAKATEELTARSLDAENAAREEAMELKKSFSELMEMFLVQQKNFDEKDAEILRLKKGYDSEIFRRFLSRFIRVDQVIRDYQERGTIDLDGLRQIALVLEDAFAEAGVAAFAPAAGTAYRDAVGVNDSPRIVHTEDPELIGKIKEVIDLGYRLNNGEIITPAKVAIYGNTKKESI